ncbi:MAG: mandelate racemase/muconate lactonizing enzyme family protein [Solirubrobacterales bacterium]|nr:mandelate racemase/muconate lactonizing enzyme family protein [Solirubrobacterales bacterium]
MRVTQIDTIRVGAFPNLVHTVVHTDQGLTGLGETFFFADAVEAHVHDVVAEYLLGADPAAIERHAAALRGYVGAASSGAEMRAASAVDIALWDLRGKALEQPLCDLLGGRSRDEIRTYNTCAGERYIRGRSAQAVKNWGLHGRSNGRHEDLEAFLNDPEGLARSLLNAGTTGMKIWPFDPYAEATQGHDISRAQLDRALEPIRRIRAAVGSEMDVMIELHALWDVPAAARIVSALDALDPYWVEDPVCVTSADALAEVQRATHVPIAAGETLTGLPDFRDMLVRDGARIVIFDVGWMGGITTARKVAALAESHERPVAPHDCTGPVVYAAATHLSLHLPNAILQESVRAFWDGWYREFVTALPVIERGMVSAPPGPGLGLELRPEVYHREDVRIRSSSEKERR